MSFAFLSGNALKLLAALSMTLDHMGVLLFPRVRMLRNLGRLALPIFALMIAEGCKYTRNRPRYFGMIFGLGVICQIVYYLVERDLYFSILITFSLSILTIYAMQYCKRLRTTASFLVFAGVTGIVWWLNRRYHIDYGFWGCMLPVLAALPHGTPYDSHSLSIVLLGLGLLVMPQEIEEFRTWTLMAIPLLLCYNGQRGKANLKYFFYIFYPAHMVVLQAIAWLRELL